MLAMLLRTLRAKVFYSYLVMALAVAEMETPRRVLRLARALMAHVIHWWFHCRPYDHLRSTRSMPWHIIILVEVSVNSIVSDAGMMTARSTKRKKNLQQLLLAGARKTLLASPRFSRLRDVARRGALSKQAITGNLQSGSSRARGAKRPALPDRYLFSILPFLSQMSVRYITQL